MKATPSTFCALFVASLSLSASETLWTYSTGAIVFGAVTMDDDGALYAGNRSGQLHSLNPDGSLRWIWDSASDWLDATPVIDDLSRVYAASWDATLYVISGLTGETEWTYSTEGPLLASPAISLFNEIYLPSSDGLLYKLNSAGGLEWAFSSNTAAAFLCSPVLASSQRTLYAGDADGVVYAINATTGDEEWSVDLTTQQTSTPETSAEVSGMALDPSGRLYVTSTSGLLYAIDADGTPRWRYEASESLSAAPVVTPDLTIVVPCHDGYLYGIDREGFQVWETYIGDTFYASAAVAEDGSIVASGYAGSAETGIASRFVSLDAEGNILWEITITDYTDASATIAPDGSIYYAAFDGQIYKIKGTSPMAGTAWPCLAGNRRATGMSTEDLPAGLIDTFPTIQESRNGWSKLDWFGSGWIQDEALPEVGHLDHGYLYCLPAVNQALWYYDYQLGAWFYTSAATPDYYFHAASGAWWFHFPGTTVAQSRWFFDTTAGQWITVD
jgi:outer membrane protein assembly factor BamB